MPIEQQSNSPVLFRFHRGLLADSMRTVVTINNVEHLKEIILKDMHGFRQPKGDLQISKYGIGIDERIDWDTHVVIWGGCVHGFLNRAFDE